MKSKDKASQESKQTFLFDWLSGVVVDLLWVMAASGPLPRIDWFHWFIKSTPSTLLGLFWFLPRRRQPLCYINYLFYSSISFKFHSLKYKSFTLSSAWRQFSLLSEEWMKQKNAGLLVNSWISGMNVVEWKDEMRLNVMEWNSIEFLPQWNEMNETPPQGRNGGPR